MLNYDSTSIPVQLEDCVVEVDTKEEKKIYKEESITDTLYMRAQEQRDDRIENEHYKYGEPKII